MKREKKEPRILKDDKKKKTSKVKKTFKIIGIILLILLILLAGLAVAGYLYVNGKLDLMQAIHLDKSKLGISEETEERLSGYRNIAIFGIDSRKDEYGEGYRSDCMIIASFNYETKEIKLVSIYRDTLMQFDSDFGLSQNLDKATHAYACGEETMAINMLNTNLDLNISEFVTVNFQSVADTIDALGGITIEIEQNEIGYMNEYIDATSILVNKKSKHITKAGVQRLDGVQAVAYSRVRYTAGGEHKRTERMRIVLEAMLNELKTKSVGELNTLADKLLPSIRISSTLKDDLFTFVPYLPDMTISNSIGFPYETLDEKINGIYYGVPINLGENVTKLHQDLFGDEEYVLPDSVKEISDTITEVSGH